jgi:lysophosphatidylcholine acyltransferase/lyso-PAF acetyltransferase
MLFVFGFYWIPEYDCRFPDAEDGHADQSKEMERPGAIVSNHVSYVDILYHMSASFPSFVAKRSVARLPLVGLISKCLGCIFVQRESKTSDFKGVSGAVTERIQRAHQQKNAPMMLLFPEGTTTNGDYLLPFKTGAFIAKAPVQPVILRYPYKRFNPAWESMSGARHVFLLLCQFVNYLEVIHLPVYYPSEQEKNDAKLYANNVRKLMAVEGNLILSDSVRLTTKDTAKRESETDMRLQ